MATLMSRLKLRFARAAREEDGAATIPFLLFLPFFMMLVISSLEMGVLMLRHVMLERSLDLSVRDLRLGTFTGTYTDFKRLICNRAGIIPNCMTTVVIELRPVSTVTWAPLSSGAICVDRANPLVPLGNPFEKGAGDELMLVRACAKFDPIVPTTGMGFQLPKDNTGAYALISTTAFVNEPEPGT
ncbi:MAG TPA: pilus assembly protein [Albidovulum sp.]|uniref:TadE/TadG family type IV pilus assembly protein n=1 Tax=Albidovulum sp. TaxID=1872424 RepID=UPI002BDAC402|nr:pilus assembly protein [Albidovulum sp.]